MHSDPPVISDKMFTSCKDCKFAIYNGNTQEGCHFNLLDKYKEVIPAYDEDKNFNVINNNVCLLKAPIGSKLSPEDAVKRISIRYHAIIILDSSKKIKKTIQALVNQSIQPSLIVLIICPNISLSDKDLGKMMGTLNSFPIKWKIEHQIAQDTIPNYIDRFIETSKDKAPWYLVVNSDYVLPADYIEQINNRYVLNVEEFGLVKPVDLNRNGLLVKTSFHAYLGGSRHTLIEDKFKTNFILYED